MGGLTATTSLTVAQQIDLTEADLNSSAVSYTVNGSKADDSVDLWFFWQPRLRHGGGRPYSHPRFGRRQQYLRGAARWVWGQRDLQLHRRQWRGSGNRQRPYCVERRQRQFRHGRGQQLTLDLLMTQIRLGKTQGAGAHVTDSVFTYTGGDDADAVTISNSYVGGGADNYVGSDGVVAFNMGNGTNSLTISTGEPTYLSLYNWDRPPTPVARARIRSTCRPRRGSMVAVSLTSVLTPSPTA